MKRPRLLSPLLLILAACTPVASREQTPVLPAPPQAISQTGRIIPVTAELWRFTPNIIQAKQDEVVTLQITGISGTHGLSIPGLGINEVIIQGQTVNVTIPTDKPGTYAFLCSVPCGSGHSEMTGQIVITP